MYFREKSNQIGLTAIHFSTLVVLLFVASNLFALTGFVCTYKIHAEEECQSSLVQCYECDSKSDPNCLDPFDFSPQAKLQVPTNFADSGRPRQNLSTNLGANSSDFRSQPTSVALNRQKTLPQATTCQGCCVKITSKLPDDTIYVKRTCTSKLQINHFIVGLVCMKESGDRGKMCFCETDYCNSAPELSTRGHLSSKLIGHLSLIAFAISLIL